MSWRAFFPDAVWVASRSMWLTDFTVYDGADKFVVSIYHDGSIDSCLPALRAEVAKRDVVTKKPVCSIPPGTVIDLTPPTPTPPPKPTQDDIDRVAWLERYKAAREAAAFDSLDALGKNNGDPSLQADCQPAWLEMIA